MQCDKPAFDKQRWQDSHKSCSQGLLLLHMWSARPLSIRPEDSSESNCGCSGACGDIAGCVDKGQCCCFRSCSRTRRSCSSPSFQVSTCSLPIFKDHLKDGYVELGGMLGVSLLVPFKCICVAPSLQAHSVLQRSSYRHGCQLFYAIFFSL